MPPNLAVYTSAKFLRRTIPLCMERHARISTVTLRPYRGVLHFRNLGGLPGHCFQEAFRTGDALMPATPHIEQHFTATESVRDVVIGMSDGLTVPFALAAGISGALASNPHASALVVTAGLAERS